MKDGDIQQCTGYLLVDCDRREGTRAVSELYRGFAVECVTKHINRVLVKAADRGPEGHYALRDALTVMLLAGIPPGFKLAMVTGVAHVQPFLLELQRDLRHLSIHLALFADEQQAVEWLRAKGAPRRGDRSQV